MLPIINKDAILLGLKADTKAEALEKMAARLYELGYVSDQAAFLAEVERREKIFATYIGYGLGLPHGKCEATREAGIAIARLSSPVVWEDDSCEMADTVIMIAARPEADDFHLRVLSTLSRALMHGEVRDTLKLGSVEEIYGLLLDKLGEASA